MKSLKLYWSITGVILISLASYLIIDMFNVGISNLAKNNEPFFMLLYTIIPAGLLLLAAALSILHAVRYVNSFVVNEKALMFIVNIAALINLASWWFVPLWKPDLMSNCGFSIMSSYPRTVVCSGVFNNYLAYTVQFIVPIIFLFCLVGCGIIVVEYFKNVISNKGQTRS